MIDGLFKGCVPQNRRTPMDSSRRDDDETLPPETTTGEEVVSKDNDASTNFELTRRELLTLAAATGGALVAESVLASPAPAMPAQTVNAAVNPVDLVLRVNGAEHRLTLDPRTTLLDALREHLHLTGSKKGCGLGQCGACTVLMDGKRVKSCLSLAALVEGREITTIEGVAKGEQLHALQAAFIEHDAFQCGYCTPGQIMAGVACIAEGHAGSVEEVRQWMSGNICRCGAYDAIGVAIHETARASGATRGA
jgi:xanthine dehydrogenase YagT iron-sulfur-binding subunit